MVRPSGVPGSVLKPISKSSIMNTLCVCLLMIPCGQFLTPLLQVGALLAEGPPEHQIVSVKFPYQMVTSDKWKLPKDRDCVEVNILF